jgi:hypothetical protein
MRLRRNQVCPIHRSAYCCSRERNRKARTIRIGVQRIEDPHHPRRYRELRSPGEMRKLLNRKIVEQNGICPICEEKFIDHALTSFLITNDAKGWEERGGTTVPTISRQCIGSAMKRRDRCRINHALQQRDEAILVFPLSLCRTLFLRRGNTVPREINL